MANRLKMAKINDILTLHRLGWSNRKIAQQLQLHRDTVARQLAEAHGKPSQAPPGSGIQNRPEAPPGSEVQNRPEAPPGSTWSRSNCEPYRTQIQEMLDHGLSAKRIHQDLGDIGLSYFSVRRFIRGLTAQQPLPFRRIEKPPGEESQVDFGTGAWIRQPNGRKRRSHVFRIVLSHSRKAYSEAVYHQTTENFIRCLENAFWYFGGVTKTLVIDNLRAAVKKADWFEPELNPKVAAFCEHYGVVILPTRICMPRHKGKVEKGIAYVQENGLKGKLFDSLEGENEHLLQWETGVADTRIHGTTRRQVAQAFSEEQPLLQKLPLERFPFFHEGQRSVHRDGHVEVAKAYYSTPPEYVGRQVWVRWDSRMVRLYNNHMEQIAVHVRAKPGSFSTQPSHLASQKISTVERGATWLLSKASCIGQHAELWATSMMEHRGIPGLRILQGLLSLTKKYNSRDIDKACEIAQSYQAYRLSDVRRLIQKQAAKQEQLEFAQDHPIIRNISVYGELVRAALHGRTATSSMFSPQDRKETGHE